MGDAIGQTLPLAIGVALSPLPIVAVVLMLVTPRASTNGPAFIVGWLLGLLGVGAIVLLASSGADASDQGQPADWVSILKLVLGGLLILVAARQWGKRPGEGEEAPAPKWMGAIDSFTGGKAFLAGAVLAGANPKNLLLSIGAATTIAQSGIDGAQQAGAYIVFALIGSIGVGTPVAIFFAMGERSKDILAEIKEWMSHNNAAIMAAICLVIGFKFIGEAISGLT